MKKTILSVIMICIGSIIMKKIFKEKRIEEMVRDKKLHLIETHYNSKYPKDKMLEEIQEQGQGRIIIDGQKYKIKKCI